MPKARATSRDHAPSPASHPIVRGIDTGTQFSEIAGVAVLLIMTAIVCYEVISRFVFNAPTIWVTEISTYLFVALVFLGLAVAQRAGGHIQVEILISTLAEPRRERLEAVGQWVGLLFIAVAGWRMARFNFSEWVYDTRDWGLLATPQWIPELPVTLGYLLFIAAVLRDLFLARPPEKPWRAWATPVIAGVALLALVLMGDKDVWLVRGALDAGTVILCIGVFLAALAWNGPSVALPVLVIYLALGVAFEMAHGASAFWMGATLVGALLMLLVLGVRVALAMGVVGMVALYILMPQPQLPILADRSWTSVNTFTLTAIPTFVLMGSLLVRSGVTTELFDALIRWFGRTPGGLAHATVGASAVFAAVSGSSLATAATLGSVTAPEMVRRGYSRRLSYGVVAAGATLGILIPPSIAMIIYGNVVGAPITVLFMAGVVPGLVLAALFMATAFFWALVVPGSTPKERAYGLGEKMHALLGIFPFLFLITAVLGSLYLGIATPTEAGAVGAAAALLLCLQRRALTLKGLYEVAVETVKVTAFLMLLVVGASIFSWVFDFLRLPRAAVEAVTEAQLAPWMVMLLIGLVYLALGTIIESISMMLMTLSVTFPIVVALGFDPIWFGVVLVLLIEIGLITPPVGIVLFILRGLSDGVPLKAIVMGVLPFIGVMLAFIVLLYAVPEIATWLPAQME
ncbi:MAG: TRAP transporter large permease subunit [Rhodospirillum sp.]|nr:TRAP transporter large permease subunit [Rhodospirillum sp.]MCF8488570.1 TRAP transporter large permease subunit [Rhodospirillum sp.]MCF8499166.1 TRAP transporter large permease subunit [Rhodospirillum sp.]